MAEQPELAAVRAQQLLPRMEANRREHSNPDPQTRSRFPLACTSSRSSICSKFCRPLLPKSCGCLRERRQRCACAHPAR